MGIFKSRGRHSAQSDSNFRTPLIIIVSVILIVVLAVIIITSQDNDKDSEINTETQFVEHETEYIKKGEKITIDDPLLGTIEIEAVEGFAKNLYKNDNFIIDENGMMTYYIDNEVASCMGVDLSEYQNDVDFNKLKDQGFEFVMLRIGGRYYSEEGGLYMDSRFFDYYEDAKEAGLKVGGYFFSQAKNAVEATEEANYLLSQIGDLDLDYPIAYDWEIIEGDTARTDSVSDEELTQCAIAFCDTIKNAGYNPIIYSNTALIYYKYDLSLLKDYDFWIADYENHPSMYYHFTMWQYDIEGQVDGIEGNVDMNICMKNY